jgi:hypothetical protein
VRFVRFLGRSLVRGLGWLLGRLDGLLIIIGTLAFGGFVFSPRFHDWPAWRLVPLICGVVMITFAVGAFCEWDDADKARAGTRATSSGAGSRQEPLRPRYDESPPYRTPRADNAWVTEHRVGVFNPGDETAHRVSLHLVSMEPYPRHILNDMQPVIPYAVPLLSGGDEVVGITLGPGREELWVLGATGTGSDGSMNVGGVSNKRWRGLPWRFDEDERCRFGYEIVSDGRPPVPFSIVVYPDNGVLRCRLEG